MLRFALKYFYESALRLILSSVFTRALWKYYLEVLHGSTPSNALMYFYSGGEGGAARVQWGWGLLVVVVVVVVTGSGGAQATHCCILVEGQHRCLVLVHAGARVTHLQGAAAGPRVELRPAKELHPVHHHVFERLLVSRCTFRTLQARQV